MKIISGGQTGVDRAALDVALELELDVGGWCPRGRLAEDGPIAKKYPLQETPTAEYAQRTEWNVRDSDGTLLLTWGPPASGTALTIEFCKQYKKPHHVIDLKLTDDCSGAAEWVQSNQISTLNVAGPRQSEDSEIFQKAKGVLRALLEKAEKKK